MTVFLNEDLRPARTDLKLITAVHIALTSVPGLVASDLQAAISALRLAIPDNAEALSVETDGNLTSTNVQAALAELQEELDAISGDVLTASQERLLAEITERSVTSFNNVTGSQLALRDGGTGNPILPFNSTIAENSFTGPSFTGPLFFEVNSGTDLTNLFLNIRTGTRTDTSLALSGSAMQSGASNGKNRYLTSSVTITTAQNAIIQSRNTTYPNYDLSGKFRIMASSIIGLISESKLDAALRAKLNATVNASITRLQRIFLNSVNVTETLPAYPARPSDVRIKVTAGVSHNLSDYDSLQPETQIALDQDVFFLTPINEHVQFFVGFTPPGTAVQQTDLGEIISGWRGYRVRYNGTEDPLNRYSWFGGVPSIQGITFDDTVKLSRGNLTSDLDTLLFQRGDDGLSEVTATHGRPVTTTRVNDFYWLNESQLPERTLADWNHVTDGRVPQTIASSSFNRVILLPVGQYPANLDWSPASTQPPPSQNSFGVVNLNASDWEEVSTLEVPPGYQGFRYLHPPFITASAANTGRLFAGSLNNEDIAALTFAPVVQIRDENLNLVETDFVNPTDRDKLHGLSLEQYESSNTESDPDLLVSCKFATLWPDPRITYVGNLGTNPLVDPVTRLAPRPDFTGLFDNPPNTPLIRDISQTTSINIAAFPNTNNVHENQWNGISIRDIGPAITGGGSLRFTGGSGAGVTDNDLVADSRGIILTGTYNLKEYDILLGTNAFTPIMRYGAATSTAGAIELGLIIRSTDRDRGAEFVLRHYRQNPAAHSTVVRRTQNLLSHNTLTNIIAGVGTGELRSTRTAFILQTNWTQATVRLKFQGFDNNTIYSNVVFEREITNLAASESSATSHVVNVAGTNYTFTSRYHIGGTPATSGQPWALQRALEINVPDITVTSHHVTAEVEVDYNVSGTILAGTSEDIPLGVFAHRLGGRYDIALHLDSTVAAHGAIAEMRYQVAINGKSTEKRFFPTPAGVSLAIRNISFICPAFGRLNRLMVLRPDTANVINRDDMSGFSHSLSRNRPFANILRVKGEKYRANSGTANDLINLPGQNIEINFGTSNRTLTAYRFAALDADAARFFDVAQITVQGDAIRPKFDMEAVTTTDIRLTFTIATITSASTSQRAFLQILGEWLVTPPGGTESVLSGLPFNFDIERNRFHTGRIEGNTTAAIDNGHTRIISFRKNHTYRFRMNITKNQAGATGLWPTTDFGIFNPSLAAMNFLITSVEGE